MARTSIMPTRPAPRSCQPSLLLGLAAGQRPFLDPGQMVVVAVAGAPHGLNERTIRRLHVGKAESDAGEAAQRNVGFVVGCALAEFDRLVEAGRSAPLDRKSVG